MYPSVLQTRKRDSKETLLITSHNFDNYTCLSSFGCYCTEDILQLSFAEINHFLHEHCIYLTPYIAKKTLGHVTGLSKQDG